MGSFTEKFRLNQRLRNSDFERSETVEHWKLWANDILRRAGYVDKVDEKDDNTQKHLFLGDPETQDMFNELSNQKVDSGDK